MQNLSIKELEKVVEKIEKYNKDFPYYIGCLKSILGVIDEIEKSVSKAIDIDLNKKYDSLSLKSATNIIKHARFVNKEAVIFLEAEIDNFKEIINYFEKADPEFKMLNAMIKANIDEQVELYDVSARIVVGLSDLGSKVSACKKYLLPKSEAVLVKRKAIQENLEAKFDQLPKELAVDPEYDSKF